MSDRDDRARPLEPADAQESPGPVEPGEPREPRPLIERIGLAAIALVLSGLFGAVAVASWSGGELFLAVMGAMGSLMTMWVGMVTLVRG